MCDEDRLPEVPGEDPQSPEAVARRREWVLQRSLRRGFRPTTPEDLRAIAAKAPKLSDKEFEAYLATIYEHRRRNLA